MSRCAVCGSQLDPMVEMPMEYEVETYDGAEGAEMRITLPYCNEGKHCNAVEAANVMDKLSEPFFLQAGRP